MAEPKPEDLVERDRIYYQTSLESIVKLRFFLAGLLFAVLSFALQFPVKSSHLAIKIVEAASWVLLAVTAALTLRDCGGLRARLTERTLEGLSPRLRVTMWWVVSAGVILLLAAKIADSFLAARGTLPP